MSGIVGILHLDGAPVDPQLLQRLTDSLVFRGPDATGIWISDNNVRCVGFGHTLLKTTPESAFEHQPFTLDGSLWIVADARVDARTELIAELGAHGEEPCASVTDVELILRAYRVWGETCLEHLLGDFAFAIWDGPRRRLLCACDHLGVKPFYYAHLGPLFIFSNTLNCVRQHPGVSNRLNDLAIADFLLFEMNRDAATTSFADIERLPPAHLLDCHDGAISIRRYWSLPDSGPIHYRREAEYLEHFTELLDTAVADRLRTDSAAILMSGGLDSPTVAVSARRVFARQGASSGLRAYTRVFDHLIPDHERHYAGLVGKALNIPVCFQPQDGECLFDGADRPEYQTPEPTYSLGPRNLVELFREIAGNHRVALTGYGGDPSLSSLISVHFRQLLKKKQFVHAMTDAWRYLTNDGRLSRLYIRTRLRRYFKFGPQLFPYPEWLNEDLQKRLDLRHHWETLNRNDPPLGSFRPEARECVLEVLWRNLFEAYDPASTRSTLEVRHPFFDLRLLNYLLALPTLPWCADKELFREAGKGVLPDAVRLRPKTPLRHSPMVAYLQRPESATIDQFEPVPKLAEYVIRSRIPPVFGEKDPWKAGMSTLPLSLNFWLQCNQVS